MEKVQFESLENCGCSAKIIVFVVISYLQNSRWKDVDEILRERSEFWSFAGVWKDLDEISRDRFEFRSFARHTSQRDFGSI